MARARYSLGDLVDIGIDEDMYIVCAEPTALCRELLGTDPSFSIDIDMSRTTLTITLSDSDCLIHIVIDRLFPDTAFVVESYHDEHEYMVIPLRKLLRIPIVTIENGTITVGLDPEHLRRYGIGFIKGFGSDVVTAIEVGEKLAAPLKTLRKRLLKRYVVERGKCECFEALDTA